MATESPTKCGKCGSAKIVPRARVVDRGDLGVDNGNVRLAVARRPHALVFKNPETVDVQARICGACGFVELFVDDPGPLYAAYTQAPQSSD